MTSRTALRLASERLADARIADARLTAEVLLCYALGRERVFLYSHPEHELSDSELARLETSLESRAAGAPTQYITGVQEFYGRPFHVGPGVLIPRPETEHVVEHALEVARGARRVLDIGTGSGALAITLALELGTSAVATDISLDALRIARGNARSLAAAVAFAACDLASALCGPFDLIVSNPPYIPAREIPHLQVEVRDHEPHVALLGGLDGTEIYQRIAPQAAGLLRPGGWLIFEIGYQGEAGVRAALAAPCWRDVSTGHDLAGLPRVIRARFEPASV